MRLTRLKTALIALSVCTTALFVGAGAVFADSGPKCGTGSSGGNVKTCFSITGPGLFVGDMHATAQVLNSTRKLQVCIHGPDPRLPKCSDEKTIKPGGILSKDWNPNSTVDAGTYCARTWRVNNDGSKTLIGEECLDVHS